MLDTTTEKARKNLEGCIIHRFIMAYAEAINYNKKLQAETDKTTTEILKELYSDASKELGLYENILEITGYGDRLPELRAEAVKVAEWMRPGVNAY